MVSTTADSFPVASAPPYTISASTIVPTSVTGSPTPGISTTYNLSSFTEVTPVSGGVAGGLVITDTYPTLTKTNDVQFPTAGSAYTVTDNTTGGTATLTGTVAPTAPAVVGVTNTQVTVPLTLPLGFNIAAGDKVTVVINGAINPTLSVGGVIQNDTFTVGGSTPPVLPGSAVLQLGNSVSAVVVTPSPPTQSVASSYTVGMKLTTKLVGGAVGVGDSITLTAPAATVFTTAALNNVLLSDASNPASSVTILPAQEVVGGTPNILTITVPTGTTLAAGDSITLTVNQVTNPLNGTYSATSQVGSFTVVTSKDAIAAFAAPYTIGSPPNNSTVTVNPNTPGVAATYTVAGIQALTPIISGTSNIIITASSANVRFPTASSEYTITDATTAADSGPLTVTANGNSNTVTLQTTKSIPAGDLLSITANGVINPSAGAYTLALTGGTLTATAVPPLTGAPAAGITYPSGGLIILPTGAIYTVAGGYALLVPNLAEFANIAPLNPASVVAATTLGTATAPRSGTLLQVAGSPAIYVTDNTGKLWVFNSPSQLLSDGYDPSLVVQVGSLGTLPIGTGTAPNAAATLADGSFLFFGGAIYGVDGGNATVIPNLSVFAQLQALDAAAVVTANSAPATNIVPANGSVFSNLAGPISVNYQGKVFLFSSIANMESLGYNPYITVPLP
jgi:hypothetical protein